MKNVYKLILGASILLLSCKKDFEEINTNPNAPTEIEPQFLLRKVIYDYGEQLSYEGFVAGNLLGQYTTAVDFNLFDRHSLSEPQYGGNPWPIIYTNLRDNETILNLAGTSAPSKVYEGPARIMKAYMTMALTDIYGDVPYTQAFKGSDASVTPDYDNQELIYTGPNGILDNLDKAIAAINAYNGTFSLQGDILFNGDLSAWVKFANSLKIKALMRISDKMDVAAEIQAIVSTNNFMQSNADNAVFSFTDGQPNAFRMAVLREGDFNLFNMSQTIEEIFAQTNDTRVATYFRPTTANTTVYNGILNGRDASGAISQDTISRCGTIFRETTGQLEANFLTAWETQFFLAEAAQKGMISGSAQTYYESGVTLCFEYWKTTIPTDFLTTSPAAYGTGNPLEQIITQKWIGNMINGYEGWIEYRRTGFPVLKTIAASLNGDVIPVRMPYPSDEQALNGSNYAAAAAKTSGNSVNAKVWWDK